MFLTLYFLISSCPHLPHVFNTLLPHVLMSSCPHVLIFLMFLTLYFLISSCPHLPHVFNTLLPHVLMSSSLAMCWKAILLFRLTLNWIVFKYSPLIAHQTHSILIIKSDNLMLRREIITIFPAISSKHINKIFPRGGVSRIFNLKPFDA